MNYDSRKLAKRLIAGAVSCLSVLSRQKERRQEEVEFGDAQDALREHEIIEKEAMENKE